MYNWFRNNTSKAPQSNKRRVGFELPKRPNNAPPISAVTGNRGAVSMLPKNIPRNVRERYNSTMVGVLIAKENLKGIREFLKRNNLNNNHREVLVKFLYKNTNYENLLKILNNKNTPNFNKKIIQKIVNKKQKEVQQVYDMYAHMDPRTLFAILAHGGLPKNHMGIIQAVLRNRRI
jgi:hypothetical protein